LGQFGVGGAGSGELGGVALGRGPFEELDAVLHGLVPDGVVPTARRCHYHARIRFTVPAGIAWRGGFGRVAGGALCGGPGYGGKHDEPEHDITNALKQGDRSCRTRRGRAAAASASAYQPHGLGSHARAVTELDGTQ